MSDLHALVARWRALCDRIHHSPYSDGENAAYRRCADDLAAALAETGRKSKVIQIAVIHDAGDGSYEPGQEVFALRDDGTMWRCWIARGRQSEWDQVDATLPPPAEEPPR